MKESIHSILARSYIAYFLSSILGIFLDSVFGFNVPIPNGSGIGLLCFIAGPALMWWAQYTSRTFTQKNHDVMPTYIHHGPYRYVRNPTHLGLVILVAGYTAVSGSIIFLAITVIGYVVSNYFYRQYESILRAMYGDKYEEYTSKTPRIL